MQAFHYGAHELIELHEVLNNTIDAINTFHLYQPYVREPELQQIMRAQLTFSMAEYNSIVNMVHGLGASAAVPYRPQLQNSHHSSGIMMHTVQPELNASQLDERDVASVMLGLHKAGAKSKLNAALETANPQIRNLLLQSVSNCANQAYEVWDYLYRRGYYPMVTLTQSDSAELLRGYRPVAPQQHWTSATAPVAPETANIAHSTSTPAVATTAGEPLQSAQSQQSMQTQNDFAAEALHTEPEQLEQPVRKRNSRSTRSE